MRILSVPFVRRLWVALALGSSLSVRAVDPGALSVQVVGNGTVSPNYDGQVLTEGNKYAMNAKPKSGFTFSGWSGSQVSNKTKLNFLYTSGLNFTATFVDRQKPTVKLNPVLGSSALSTNALYVGGSANDNDAVTSVFCRVNGGSWQSASTLNGWANWWFIAGLAPGNNLLEAYALDASGNASKTNVLKLVYDVAPISLAGQALVAVRPDSSTVTFDFGTNVFTEPTGAGNYKFKKLNSNTGQIEVAYTSPPTATDAANKVKVTLHFETATNGTFADSTGTNTFTLTPNHDWAPDTIGGSTVILDYADGSHQTVAGFLSSPTVVTNSQTALVNPLPLVLTSDYPGAVGDRVYVAFAHQHFNTQSGAWQDSTAKAYIGSVIAIGDNAVTVIMDKLPKNNEADRYAVLNNATLDIVTSSYDNYAEGSLVTNSTAIYDYASSSPDGAVLTLLPPEKTAYFTLLFTNADAGIFYEENYAVTNGAFASDSGSFSFALAPQISTAPAAVTATNGGSARFSVIAKGSPTLTYQWQFNGTNLLNGTNVWGTVIGGVTTTNLTLAKLTTNAIGSYRVAVTNVFGSVTSSAAALTLTTNSSSLTP